MLNLRKLSRIAFLAFGNALRLHSDAITLYKAGRYPSAYLLSVIAQEELGKMHIVNDFVWRAKTEGQVEGFEDKWLELLYKHQSKQYAFLRNSPLNSPFSKKGLAITEGICRGSLEEMKHNSVYVGLRKHKGRVDKNGKVRHPHQIKKGITHSQITKINDYLLVVGIGIIYGQFDLDNGKVESILKNKKFLKAIRSNWPDMNKFAKSRARKIQEYFKGTIIEL